MEQQQRFLDKDRNSRLWETACTLGVTETTRFAKKWGVISEGRKLKRDGCLIGEIGESLVVERDSWLKIQIELCCLADITFSADAVMFVNGEIGEYTQNFKQMLGTAEFSLPVAKGCRITVATTPAEMGTWTCFILIPMEENIVSSYREDDTPIYEDVASLE